MKEDIKLCKDCKFFQRKYLSDDLCMKEALDTNPVNGRKYYLTCYEVRRIPWSCYKLGRNFEPSPETNHEVIPSVWSGIKQVIRGLNKC